MKALLQRVTQSSVHIEGSCVGEIGPGMLVLLGLDRDDTQAVADKMLDKLLGYRMFADAEGRMNANVRQSSGGVLLVSQFTLSAQTDKGLRPGFSSALAPAQAEPLYRYFYNRLVALHEPVAAGQFGADMQVSLINDGPVTFMLEVNA